MSPLQTDFMISCHLVVQMHQSFDYNHLKKSTGHNLITKIFSKALTFVTDEVKVIWHRLSEMENRLIATVCGQSGAKDSLS